MRTNQVGANFDTYWTLLWIISTLLGSVSDMVDTAWAWADGQGERPMARLARPTAQPGLQQARHLDKQL